MESEVALAERRTPCSRILDYSLYLPRLKLPASQRLLRAPHRIRHVAAVHPHRWVRRSLSLALKCVPWKVERRLATAGARRACACAGSRGCSLDEQRGTPWQAAREARARLRS